MAAPLLDVADLRFEWPDGFTLSVARFALAAGEAVAVVGPSGCGKSTFLHLAAGILRPAAGAVRFEGTDWAARSERERRRRRRTRIGLVFQEFELLDHLDATENVLLPRLVAGEVDAGARARAEQLLEAAGIAHLAGRKPRRMSHGERQRVALCRALSTAPSLVLADEPTGNLDPASGETVRALLLGGAREGGGGLVFVTHDRTGLDGFDRVVDAAEWAS
ncbi:MAG: ATP-binding cassette domain-containing protein [Planctomycetota bacterium JB042]